MNEVFDFIYKTSLHIAVEKRNNEIINLLLSKQEIDVNIKSIADFHILYHFKIEFLMTFHNIHLTKFTNNLKIKFIIILFHFIHNQLFSNNVKNHCF